METFEPNRKERHQLVPTPHFSYTKSILLVYYSASCCFHVTIFPEGDTGTRNSASLPLLLGGIPACTLGIGFILGPPALDRVSLVSNTLLFRAVPL